jgi:hypothetical protein
MWSHIETICKTIVNVADIHVGSTRPIATAQDWTKGLCSVLGSPVTFGKPLV